MCHFVSETCNKPFFFFFSETQILLFPGVNYCSQPSVSVFSSVIQTQTVQQSPKSPGEPSHHLPHPYRLPGEPLSEPRDLPQPDRWSAGGSCTVHPACLAGFATVLQLPGPVLPESQVPASANLDLSGLYTIRAHSHVCSVSCTVARLWLWPCLRACARILPLCCRAHMPPSMKGSRALEARTWCCSGPGLETVYMTSACLAVARTPVTGPPPPRPPTYDYEGG